MLYSSQRKRETGLDEVKTDCHEMMTSRLSVNAHFDRHAKYLHALQPRYRPQWAERTQRANSFESTELVDLRQNGANYDVDKRNLQPCEKATDLNRTFRRKRE